MKQRIKFFRYSIINSKISLESGLINVETEFNLWCEDMDEQSASFGVIGTELQVTHHAVVLKVDYTVEVKQNG